MNKVLLALALGISGSVLYAGGQEKRSADEHPQVSPLKKSRTTEEDASDSILAQLREELTQFKASDIQASLKALEERNEKNREEFNKLKARAGSDTPALPAPPKRPAAKITAVPQLTGPKPAAKASDNSKEKESSLRTSQGNDHSVKKFRATTDITAKPATGTQDGGVSNPMSAKPAASPEAPSIIRTKQPLIPSLPKAPEQTGVPAQLPMPIVAKAPEQTHLSAPVLPKDSELISVPALAQAPLTAKAQEIVNLPVPAVAKPAESAQSEIAKTTRVQDLLDGGAAVSIPHTLSLDSGLFSTKEESLTPRKLSLLQRLNTIKSQTVQRPAQSSISCIMYSPLTKELLVGCLDCSIRKYSQLSPLSGNKIGEHDTSVKCMIVDPVSQKYLISGSFDGAIKVWDIAGQRCVASWFGHNRALLAFFINPENPNILISTSEDGTLKLWDLGSIRQAGELKGECIVDKFICSHELTFSEPVTAVTFIPSEPTVAFIGNGTEIVLYDLSNATKAYSWDDNVLLSAPIAALCGHPENSDLIILGTRNGALFIWDITKPKESRIVAQLKAPASVNISSLTKLSIDSKQLVLQASDTIALWNLTNGRFITSVRVSGTIASFVLDQTKIVIATVAGQLFTADVIRNQGEITAFGPLTAL